MMKDSKKIDPLELPSNRKFGNFLCLLLLLSAIYCLYTEQNFESIIFIVICISIAIITYKAPDLLHVFKVAWMKLGYFLGQIFNPLILGLLFFFIITPLALILKLFGRDELKLKANNSKSYWLLRESRAQDKKSLKHIF